MNTKRTTKSPRRAEQRELTDFCLDEVVLPDGPTTMRGADIELTLQNQVRRTPRSHGEQIVDTFL